jgi:hypothetical protein
VPSRHHTFRHHLPSSARLALGSGEVSEEI